MAQALDHIPLREGRWQQTSLIAGVSLAHFVSHFYILLLPPLFFFIRQDYNVSYTELGVALSMFSLVSLVFQTPVGFLVDRYGPRLNLIAGIVIGAASIVVAAMVDSYWVLVAMFGVLGLGNTVYHPADYALLSEHVNPERMPQAFSVHTFCGLLGGAVAPATLLFLQAHVGWRGAFMGAALLGFASAAVLMLQRPPPPKPAAAKAPGFAGGLRLLMAPAILLNVVMFILIALTTSSVTNYLVVALNDLHATPIATANTALSVSLFAAAAGVLLGGLILTWTSRHTVVAVACLTVTGVTSLLLALVDFGPVGLIVVVTLAGLAGGTISPSRDMIVRSVTPPGAFGAVFGFVSNGFNLAGIAAPVLLGMLIDQGFPRWVFISAAVAAVLCILTVIAGARRGHAV